MKLSLGSISFTASIFNMKQQIMSWRNLEVLLDVESKHQVPGRRLFAIEQQKLPLQGDSLILTHVEGDSEETCLWVVELKFVISSTLAKSTEQRIVPARGHEKDTSKNSKVGQSVSIKATINSKQTPKFAECQQMTNRNLVIFLRNGQ